MTVRTVAAMAVIALAAACKPSGGGEVALENVSIAEASKQMNEVSRLQAGQWETQTRFLSVEIPGAPKEVADALGKSLTADVRTASDCLTPEEAERPAADMFAGQDSGQCRYEKFAMAKGRMDAVMVCKPADRDGEVRMTMAGDFTPTNFAFDMNMDVSGGAMPGAPGMKMRARTEGRRTGECTAPAEKAG